MTQKSEKIKTATQNIKSHKIVLYHILEPINQQQIQQIKANGYFEPSKSALGGQSNGYYFFTTHGGATHHIETNRDSWVYGDDKHAYIIECEIDLNDVKYPIWKLDYEAMQDFLFDMIVDSGRKQKIKFNNIEIGVTDDNKLTILENKKFSKIKSFSADKHSGLVEQIADFLYTHNSEFKNTYDKLLQDVFMGVGENLELYAVKTTQKQKITNITQLDDKPVNTPVKTMSQSDKFWARYGKRNR